MRKAILDRGGEFVDLRSTGALEMFGPGNRLTVSRPQHAGFDDETQQLKPEILEKEFCGVCRGIDFHRLLSEDGAKQPLFASFADLAKSSESCPLCALVCLTLVDPNSFIPDDSRPVTLGSGSLGESVAVSFPSREEGYEELVSERCARLRVFTESGCEYQFLASSPVVHVAESYSASSPIRRNWATPPERRRSHNRQQMVSRVLREPRQM